MSAANLCPSALFMSPSTEIILFNFWWGHDPPFFTINSFMNCLFISLLFVWIYLQVIHLLHFSYFSNFVKHFHLIIKLLMIFQRIISEFWDRLLNCFRINKLRKKKYAFGTSNYTSELNRSKTLVYKVSFLSLRISKLELGLKFDTSWLITSVLTTRHRIPKFEIFGIVFRS